MPQNNVFLPATIVGGTKQVPMKVDATGNLMVASGGISAAYSLAAGFVQVKVGAGRLFRISVTTAGTANGSLYDSSTIGGVANSNLIGSIPDAIGIYVFEWPFANGLVVYSGTGQTVSVSYS